MTQFTHNFFPDVSWSKFLLVGSFPNRDHIMGIDSVETRTIQFCHFFLQIFANFSEKKIFQRSCIKVSISRKMVIGMPSKKKYNPSLIHYVYLKLNSKSLWTPLSNWFFTFMTNWHWKSNLVIFEFLTQLTHHKQWPG